MNVTALGMDLAKNLLQVHGVDARGKAVLRKQLQCAQLAPFLRICRSASLAWRCVRAPILGPYTIAFRAHGPVDGSAVRQVIRQNEQERRCGCGGDLRGQQVSTVKGMFAGTEESM
jgi:hypothetical protein